MYRIKRFGVIRTATVVALAYVIVFAILFLPFALLSVAFAPRGGSLVVAGIIFFAVILLVVYPLMIWIFTAIACLVYNLAARWVGGIEVEIERPPTWAPPAVQGGWPQSTGPGQWSPMGGPDPGQPPAGSTPSTGQSSSPPGPWTPPAP